MLAIKKNGCSEVYKRAKDDDFTLLIVIPTISAKTSTCVVADTTSGQYLTDSPKHWPGRPDRYPIRVDVTNVRYTTIEKVRKAIKTESLTWASQWTVAVVDIDEDELF